MTDIIDVKKKIKDVLVADAGVLAIVSDRVYLEWFERAYTLPCVTIIDSAENGSVGLLGGTLDEYNSLVQVDVWCVASTSKSGPLNRDELAKAVKVALGKKANFAVMQAAGFILGSPDIRALDELDVKQPLYRKSMRFPVLYYSESYA